MNNKERIFRELVASIVSSRLKASDLRELAELLTSDGSFSRDVARTIYDISYRISPQEQLAFSDHAESGVVSSDGGLTDLTYSIVQRRRMSKERLITIFRKIAPEVRWSSHLRDTSVREMIASFFKKATTVQAQEFLNELGMEVEEDPYLGGISSRSRK